MTAYAQAAAEVVGIDPADPAVAAARFLVWLGATRRPWLIVHDDLTEPANLDGWWPPTSTNGRVIVTTRRHDASLLSHGRLVEVGLFTPEQAHAYLADKFSDQPQRLIEAIELTTDLGFLPLALAQAAAYIADRDIDCAAYRERLRDQRRSLADLLPEPGTLPDEHRTTLAATWTLSIRAADQLNPAGLASPMLAVLSLLAPNGVPIGLVTRPTIIDFLARHRSSGQTQPISTDDARDSLACLRRLNLATISAESTDSTEHRFTVRVHVLVQRSTREQSAPDLMAAAARACADALVATWPLHDQDPGFGDLLRTNTSALRMYAEDQLWDHALNPVLFRAARSLGETGLVAAAVAYLQQLTTEAERRLGPNHSDTLAARYRLAWWQGRSGDPAGAAAAYEVLLADRLRLFGPHDPDTLDVRNNLASWQGMAGDPVGAAAALEALLADLVQVLHPDHPHIMSARNNLASMRGRAGDAAGAVAAFETLLTDLLRVLGPDHPDTFTARNNLGFWRGRAGDVAGAVAELDTLQADMQRVLGPDHPDTLITRSDLANMRGEAGDSTGAAIALTRLLSDRLRVLGPDHPEIVTTRRDLARWRDAARGCALSANGGGA